MPFFKLKWIAGSLLLRGVYALKVLPDCSCRVECIKMRLEPPSLGWNEEAGFSMPFSASLMLPLGNRKGFTDLFFCSKKSLPVPLGEITKFGF